MIKFSITIPAYKGKFLREAIESCMAQTYQNYELIIVDDCSPEKLKDIVKPFLNDNRIKFYRNKKNCGALNVVDNWNICLSYCTGDYVICMGDDDRLLPCCLEEYAKLINQYPNIGVVHGWTELIDENSEFYDIQHPRPLHEGPFSLCWNRWNGRNKQYVGDFCYNVELLKKDGGFYFLPLAWASDDITAVRAARETGIANTQVLCFQYRVSRYTISKTGSQEKKMDATLMEKEWYIKFFESSNPQNANEEKFKIMLIQTINQHFKNKYKSLISKDIKNGRFWRVFFWLGKRKKYGVSAGRVLFACLQAFLNKFHGM